MLRSPMAPESVFKTESKPGMARSATKAPRSAGCSYARELISGNRMCPRSAGRDSVVMPSSVRVRPESRSVSHLEDAADESHRQLEDETKDDPGGADDNARQRFAILKAGATGHDVGHDAQHEADRGGTGNDGQDEADDAERIARIGCCWLRGGLVVGHSVIPPESVFDPAKASLSSPPFVIRGCVSCGSCGRGGRYSPTDPSISSRTTSRCPTCRAYSCSKCARIQPRVGGSLENRPPNRPRSVNSAFPATASVREAIAASRAVRSGTLSSGKTSQPFPLGFSSPRGSDVCSASKPHCIQRRSTKTRCLSSPSGDQPEGTTLLLSWSSLSPTSLASSVARW